MLQAGRSYLYEMTRELLQRAERREPIDMKMRGRVRLALTQATDFASQAADIAYRLGGGTSVYETSALQRCFRDVHAVTQHFMVASTNYETVGRIMLGLDPGTPTI
jgi:alkylation response protein AidB-like acyl-CoA dehydrogenase